MTRPQLSLLALLGASVALCAGSLFIGAASLVHPAHHELRSTFLMLRAGRTASGFMAGLSLAVAGVLVQGVFGNPLASPSILGTTAGASAGGQLCILGFEALLGASGAGIVAGGAGFRLSPALFLPLACVLGALGALLLLLAAQRYARGVNGSPLMLLLVGFLLSSVFGSMGGLLTSLASTNPELARAIVAFRLGDVSANSPDRILLALPLAAGGALAAFRLSGPLDVLAAGHTEAQSLGVDVSSVRLVCILWAAMLTTAAVSLGGGVAFVGLIVPHGMRKLTGPNHRHLVPAAALGGGLFLVLCDTVARSAPFGIDLPLGVLTGLVGAPVFFFLLLRRGRREAQLHA